MNMKRWLKWYEVDSGKVRFQFTDRETDEDDRPGSDVRHYFHAKAVSAAEQSGKCLSLVAKDQDFPAAMKTL